jgi:hypothetical protein
MLSRDCNATTPGTNPYLAAGVSLKYKDGILMAGGLYNDTDGYAMLRSTDEGLTWNSVTGEFARECAYYSLDVSGMWIATGSDGYKTISNNFTSSTNTIKYSTDAGQTWTTATGDFTMFGYEVVYGNGIWMATGVNGYSGMSNYYEYAIKYSSNGSNWSNVDLSTNPLFGNISDPDQNGPIPLGSMNYDGSNWNVFVHRTVAPMVYVTEIYSSPTPTGTWVARDVTSEFPTAPFDQTRRFVTYTRPNYLRTSQSKIINIDLTFGTGIGNGPTITSLTGTSFVVFQYIPLSIPLTATGTDGQIYFFYTIP